MAAGDRTTGILGRVRLRTGLDTKKYPDSLIYSTIGLAAQELAERILCLEQSGTITIDANGDASTPAGFYRLKQIVMPTNVRFQPTELDPQRFDLVKRQLFSAATTYVQWYKIWGNGATISFYPVPAIATWTILYYGLPTTTPSASVDPETPARMDRMIEYYVCSDILPIDQSVPFRALYNQELEREFLSQRRTKTVNNQISYIDI